VGKDLRLLPFDSETTSRTVLSIERRDDLFTVLAALLGRDVPDSFQSYVAEQKEEGSHLGLTIETPYGLPVKYVLAKALKALSDHPDVVDCWENRAAWAFIQELPDRWKVALFWS
jgi:hypothetical protein